MSRGERGESCPIPRRNHQGDGDAVNRWLPIIRQHKAEILAELSTDYTLAHLAEIDRLLTSLAELERWEPSELEQRLAERRRMAPDNVIGVLRVLQSAHAAALAGWAGSQAERANIVLCRIVN